MLCEERIWFQFEVKSFVLGFRCKNRAGHKGRHQTTGNQRQVGDDGSTRLEPYTVHWGKDDNDPATGNISQWGRKRYEP